MGFDLITPLKGTLVLTDSGLCWPHGQCGHIVNGRLPALTGNQILIQITFVISMKMFTALEGNDRNMLQATAVFLSSRGLQTFDGAGPPTVLWVSPRNARRKPAVSRIPNGLILCVNFVVYAKCTNEAAERVMQPDGLRVGDLWLTFHKDLRSKSFFSFFVRTLEVQTYAAALRNRRAERALVTALYRCVSLYHTGISHVQNNNNIRCLVHRLHR